MNLNKNKILIFDTAYSLENIKKRELLDFITRRSLGGYFTHVYSVHPFASIVTSEEWSAKHGKSQWYPINDSHTFIEGKIGRFGFLKWIPPLNFLLSQIALFLELRKLIKRENIQLIRARDMYYLGLFALLLSRICNIPFMIRVGSNSDKIYESTGQPIQKRFFRTRKIEKKVERFVLPKANLVAAANQDNLNFAIANGAKKETSTIFRYGNSLYKGHFEAPEKRLEGYSLLSELNLEKKPFLICIGRLEPVKLSGDALETLSNCRKEGHDVNLIMVGDGSMLKELKQKAKDLGIEDYVFFAGNKTQGWLSRVIPLAAVVLSPLTGRALSEAALGNVAIVAYDLDWQGEIIINEETGLLVPAFDVTAFSNATIRFLKDKPFAKKMGMQLRSKALDMLDFKKLDQKEIQAYEELKKRYYS